MCVLLTDNSAANVFEVDKQRRHGGVENIWRHVERGVAKAGHVAVELVPKDEELRVFRLWKSLLQ